MPVTHRRPLQVVFALRADHLDDLFLHQLGEHAKPDADAQGEQPLPRQTNQLAQRLLHARRQPEPSGTDLPPRYGPHGGSSCLERRLLHSPRSRRDRTRREDRHLKFYELRDNLRGVREGVQSSLARRFLAMTTLMSRRPGGWQ